MAKQMEVNGKVGNDKPVELSEIGKEQAIDLAGEKVSPKDLDLEAFMNEPVTVRVEPTAVQGEDITPIFNVNGVNQPIIRGKATIIKRKYLEALARCRTTTIRQVRPNPYDQSVIQNVPTTVPTYPFVVLEDKNPRGRAWLEGILAQS
jgi:hypothetical protein